MREAAPARDSNRLDERNGPPTSTPESARDDHLPGLDELQHRASELASQLSSELREALSASLDVLVVRWCAIGLSVKKGAFWAVVGLACIASVSIAAAYAGVLVVRGVTQGIAELSGHVWIGNLAGGSLAIAVLGGLLWLAWRRVETTWVRHVRARFVGESGEESRPRS